MTKGAQEMSTVLTGSTALVAENAALRSRVAVLEKVLGNVEQYVAAWAFEYRSKPSSEHNDAQLKLIAKSLKDMRTALSGEAG